MRRREFLAALAGVAPFGHIGDMARRCGVQMPAAVNAASWDTWVRDRDIAIRARLRRGEEDSLVNFVLFGNSFTNELRVNVARPDAALIERRLRAFVLALDNARTDERVALLRDLVPKERASRWVHEQVARYLDEHRQFRTMLDRAPAGDSLAANLYKNRGLSVDTNFRPDFAIETALQKLKNQRVIAQVTRATIIGPGLDFTDKDNGYDYYPLQTLQPLAIVDTLLRLGLSTMANLRVSVFDISPLTLGHLAQAKGKPYTIQMALARDRRWANGARDYWRHFGDHIGTPVAPMNAPKQVGELDRRAVRVGREVVDVLEPQDLDAVTQSATVPAFDLIIGTNVFVYYDRFEQMLAMSNIDAMLRPGGLLLTNTDMPDCAGEALHRIGSQAVRYSDAPGDEDRIEIYLKSSLRRSLPPE